MVGLFLLESHSPPPYLKKNLILVFYIFPMLCDHVYRILVVLERQFIVLLHTLSSRVNCVSRKLKQIHKYMFICNHQSVGIFQSFTHSP